MTIWNSGFARRMLIVALGFGLALSVSSTTPALAGADGECHFHGTTPAPEATVMSCAQMHKERLIKKGTIEPSWSAIKHDSIKQIEGESGQKAAWQVTFKDSTATDKSKETLYMFFTLSGNFLAVNFTGS